MEDFDPSLCMEEAFVLRKITKWLGTRGGLTLPFWETSKTQKTSLHRTEIKDSPKGALFVSLTFKVATSKSNS